MKTNHIFKNSETNINLTLNTNLSIDLKQPKLINAKIKKTRNKASLAAMPTGIIPSNIYSDVPNEIKITMTFESSIDQ